MRDERRMVRTNIIWRDETHEGVGLRDACFGGHFVVIGDVDLVP